MCILTFTNLKKTLAECKYFREDDIQDIYEFSVLGDSIKFWPPICKHPVCAYFFGEELEKVAYIKQLEKETKNYQKIFQLSTDSHLEEAVKKYSNWNELILYLQTKIEVKDYVVHENHGVAVYSGVHIMGDVEYMTLNYADEDKLYIPFSQLSKVTKFVGVDNHEPKITRLNSSEWSRVTSKVKEDVVKTANELLENFALRVVSECPKIEGYTTLYDEFCADFEYEMTQDQKKSIYEIETDLTNGTKPMARLLIGDVGFGKTEVAMRATFIVAENNYKVMVICPTTILALQHYELFRKRFEKYGLRVGMLSGLRSDAENKSVIDALNKGNIDIIIGTHRLLSDDIKISDLGLLVIDEEQKFGVKQKEKLKARRFGVHVLSMSATPIPRTLSMTLSSLQDMSVITTPPPGRKAISTSQSLYDVNKIKEVIHHEVERGGQCYIIHNDVKTIHTFKARLETELKEVRFALAYSNNNNLRSRENDDDTLEKTLLDFYNREYDVLISTTIIENGIDMPNVNTIVINKAQLLGLSQLHQLRGRVGRSSTQSYCYLFYDFDDSVKENHKSKSISRIESIVKYQQLGSGFDIANEDLSLRGGGNILGKEQSGNIQMVGYSMFLKLLDEEIEKIKST